MSDSAVLESSREALLARCLAIIAKNVPLTDALLSQLADCQLLGDEAVAMSNRKSAKGSTRRQPDQQLFASMATLDAGSLRQLAACLRASGHPLMAELLLQTVPDDAAQADAGSQRLPQSLLDALASSGSTEAETQLRQLLTESQLLVWCHQLFDPAGADVMSLRRQHAEESWRAAKELREKSADMAELQMQLSAAQSAIYDRDQTIAQLEASLLKTSSDSYRASLDSVRDQVRQFESDGADHLPAENVELHAQEPEDETPAAFEADFSRFLARCRAMLDERRQLIRLARSLSATVSQVEFDSTRSLARELARQMAELADENALLTARQRLLRTVLDEDDSRVSLQDAEAASDELVAAVGSLRRQIAERDRRIAALQTGTRSTTDENDEAEESETADAVVSSRHHRRSVAVTRAWDEVAPAEGDISASQRKTANGAGDLRRRFSVLPDIGQRGSGVPAEIPHSHRKATKREAAVKKKEPPGKPLSANVVSLS